MWRCLDWSRLGGHGINDRNFFLFPKTLHFNQQSQRIQSVEDKKGLRAPTLAALFNFLQYVRPYFDCEWRRFNYRNGLWVEGDVFSLIHILLKGFHISGLLCIQPTANVLISIQTWDILMWKTGELFLFWLKENSHPCLTLALQWKLDLLFLWSHWYGYFVKFTCSVMKDCKWKCTLCNKVQSKKIIAHFWRLWTSNLQINRLPCIF